MTDRPAPDLTAGVPLTDLKDGVPLAGRAGEDDAILVRSGGEIFAIGAHCTHYHGPLADGLVVGDTVRCPWHHACFNLRTGEPLRAPALDPVPCWRVERVGDRVFVREKMAEPSPPAAAGTGQGPRAIVIVGGGAAGLAAADMLRRRGYDGSLTLVSADDFPPCDRPNLSKDFLAGTAQEDWIPLRAPEFYGERRIDLMLGTRVSSLDLPGRSAQLENGSRLAFDALLLATGADPVTLDIPGAETGRVHSLRTFADSRAIVQAAGTAKRALVIGASFIGLEVAASLRARGLEVDVVAPESQPLARVLGPEVGAWLQRLHESHGVRFHLGRTVNRIDGPTATLTDQSTVDADLVVAGVGVRPSIALAERAGLALDRGVLVDEYLQTSVPGVYAAGDIARWPDPHTGDRIRVEHWVVAERQGQAAAVNMLGGRVRFDSVPFFWSQHYDVAINYVGHAERWDSVRIDGTLESGDAEIGYFRDGRRLAVATVGRDRASLEAEAAMERS
ncbi:MAG TPA: FAD-dependent oxidoreductase [Vicinamibacterales bacterium]|nr:FAD-dependent oxidoreductase [Vicinamibacterales bacterium]